MEPESSIGMWIPNHLFTREFSLSSFSSSVMKLSQQHYFKNKTKFFAPLSYFGTFIENCLPCMCPFKLASLISSHWSIGLSWHLLPSETYTWAQWSLLACSGTYLSPSVPLPGNIVAPDPMPSFLKTPGVSICWARLLRTSLLLRQLPSPSWESWSHAAHMSQISTSPS